MDEDVEEELQALVQQALRHPASDSYAQLADGVTKLVAQASAHTVTLDSAASEQLRGIVACLSRAASSLSPTTHATLLQPLYRLSLWTLPRRLAVAWVTLLQHLAAAKAAFVAPAVSHLVAAFAPPPAASPDVAEGLYEADARTVEVHGQLVAALAAVLRQRPLAAAAVREAVGARLPHRVTPRRMQCAYVRALLLFAETEEGRAVEDTVLLKVVERAAELDCDIRWAAIAAQLAGAATAEAAATSSDDDDDGAATADAFAAAAAAEEGLDVEEGTVFAMEGAVERLHVSSPRADAAVAAASAVGQLGFEGGAAPPAAASEDGQRAAHSLAVAAVLDPLMALLLSHLNARARRGAAARRALADATFAAFERVLLPSPRVKFSPFLVFHAAAVGDAAAAPRFVQALTNLVCDASQMAVSRSAAAAFLASFLARFAALPPAALLAALTALATFAASTSAAAAPALAARRHSWAPLTAAASAPLFPAATAAPASSTQAAATHEHEVFHAACQALLYALCFHLPTAAPPADASSSMPAALVRLTADSVLPTLRGPLAPLAACLPSVAAEFARRVACLGIADLTALVPPPDVDVVGRRFEMLFPFDPYLLPASAPLLDLASTYRAWRHGAAAPRVPAPGAAPGAAAADGAAASTCSDSDDDDGLDDGAVPDLPPVAARKAGSGLGAGRRASAPCPIRNNPFATATASIRVIPNGRRSAAASTATASSPRSAALLGKSADDSVTMSLSGPSDAAFGVGSLRARAALAVSGGASPRAPLGTSPGGSQLMAGTPDFGAHFWPVTAQR